MLLGLIRFLRGYVLFDVRGRYPERFLNITSRAGVRLWKAGRRDDGLTAEMYMRDYLKIRPLARSSGVRLNITARRGLPVYAKKYRGRLGLFIGAFVFILTVFVMSQFIWSVEITGLNRISESEMRSLLSDHGLYIGTFVPTFDGPWVSREVMLDDSRVGWMAINVIGSYASVEIKEEDPAPEMHDADEPCNVKASRDGAIISIHAGEGKVLLKEGSGVVAGQLVVSGVMENAQGGVRLVRAEAELLASTYHAASFSVPLSCTALFPNGREGERSSLSLYGLRLPIKGYSAGAEKTAVSDRFDCLSPLGVDLPVGTVCEKVSDIEEKRINLNENSAEELLQIQAKLYELFSLSSCTVDERRFSLKQVGDDYTFSAEWYCTEDIAVQEPIRTE